MSEGTPIPNEDAPAYTDIEQQAMDNGWSPDGTPKGGKSKTAEEWLETESAYQKINRLEKAHTRDRESIEAMKGMMEGIRERERIKTIAELNSQKKQALEEENYDGVIAIDEKIAQERVKPEPQRNVAYEEWIESNSWYNDDPRMRQYAEDIATGYAGRNEKMPPAEVYKYVEEEVKIRFPEKFETKSRPTAVEGASKGRVVGGHASLSDLDSYEQDIAKTLIKDGVFKNADEYMAEYSK